MRGHVSPTVLTIATLIATLDTATAVAQERRGPSPDRMFEYMDRNKDGELSGDEVRRLPEPMRQSLGVDGDRGITRDEFVDRAPRAFAEMRRRAEENGGRGFGRGSGDGDRDRDRGRWGDRDRRDEQPAKKPPEPIKIVRQPREPVTIVLPDSFADGDTDGDGQIGMYEWRLWKNTSLREFMAMDLNGDGFLTPREAQRIERDGVPEVIDVRSLAQTGPADPPAVESASDPSTSDESTSLPQPVAAAESPSAPNDSATPEPSNSTASAQPSERDLKQAKFFFGLLDRDKDGTVTPGEWDNSRRLRPRFEQAGVDLSQPMNEQQFVKVYLESVVSDS